MHISDLIGLMGLFSIVLSMGVIAGAFAGDVKHRGL